MSTAPNSSPLLSSRAQYGLIAGFYGAMSAIGLVWMFWRGDPMSTRLLASSGKVLLAIELGVVAGAAVVLISDVLTESLEWANRLRREIVVFMAPLTRTKAVAMALGSGIGEELLFRGGLQPLAGIWITSIVFGVAHVGFEREMGGWAIFAALMGLLLGGLFDLTGGLLAPMIAHATINGIQLWWLADEIRTERETHL